jgi:hypothetical protein
VDETPELDEIYSKDSSSVVHGDSPAHTAQSPVYSQGVSTVDSETLTNLETASWTPRSLYTGTQISSPTKRRRTNDSLQSFQSSPRQSHGQGYHVHPDDSNSNITRSNGGSPNQGHEDTIASLLHAADLSDHGHGFPSHLLNSPVSHHSSFAASSPPFLTAIATLQEACLMRYFIDNLACWFDLTDPARHFALTVPLRAAR